MIHRGWREMRTKLWIRLLVLMGAMIFMSGLHLLSLLIFPAYVPVASEAAAFMIILICLVVICFAFLAIWPIIYYSVALFYWVFTGLWPKGKKWMGWYSDFCP